MTKYKSEIKGNLDIYSYEDGDDDETCIKILIHGDSEGLISLAELLMRIAKTNQDELQDLPMGARKHIHLDPKFDLSSSSQSVIIGRLDAKGTGEFYSRFIKRKI